jgi:hypothetical protein
MRYRQSRKDFEGEFEQLMARKGFDPRYQRIMRYVLQKSVDE